MNKLIMSDYLFHGFMPYRIYRQNLNYFEFQKAAIEDSSKTLKEILNTGYILTRNDLKKFLSFRDYFSLKKKEAANWNGMNRVSICEHIGKTTGLYEDLYNSDVDYILMDSDFAFNVYISQYPSLILDSKLLKELKVCHNPEKAMIGEIQVEENISIDYAVGVALPSIKLNKDLDSIVNCIRFPNECHLVSHEIMKEEMYDMNEEDFVKKYYYNVIIFENIIKGANSNLKLYDISSGNPILSYEDMVDHVKELKKKYI